MSSRLEEPLADSLPIYTILHGSNIHLHISNFCWQHEFKKQSELNILNIDLRSLRSVIQLLIHNQWEDYSLALKVYVLFLSILGKDVVENGGIVPASERREGRVRELSLRWRQLK